MRQCFRGDTPDDEGRAQQEACRRLQRGAGERPALRASCCLSRSRSRHPQTPRPQDLDPVGCLLEQLFPSNLRWRLAVVSAWLISWLMYASGSPISDSSQSPGRRSLSLVSVAPSGSRNGLTCRQSGMRSAIGPRPAGRSPSQAPLLTQRSRMSHDSAHACASNSSCFSSGSVDRAELARSASAMCRRTASISSRLTFSAIDALL